jgi:hypothetical protein
MAFDIIVQLENWIIGVSKTEPIQHQKLQKYLNFSLTYLRLDFRSMALHLQGATSSTFM